MRRSSFACVFAAQVASACASRNHMSRESTAVVRGTSSSEAASTQAVSASDMPSLHYEISVSATALDVSVTLIASHLASPAFMLPWARSSNVREAAVADENGKVRPLSANERSAGEWALPECQRSCKLTYRIDVSATKRRRGFDEGIGIQTATLTTVRMLLAEPSQFDPNAPVEVAWTESTRFVSGLLPLNGERRARFVFDAWDESTFAGVGDMPCRELPRKGARCCIVGDLRMADDAFGKSFARAEDGVTKFYGRVASPALTVFAAAVPRAREIVFGKVRAMAGPSIAFFVGENFEKEQDAKNDWVMVHELLHLGFPTLFDARWFSEGIATVFEPVIRLRMGDVDEAYVWKGFADNLPRGLPALNAAGALRESRGIDAMYWASSTLLFEWEHALRAATNNRLGVEHALARLAQKFEGTPASHLSTLEGVIADLDATTETQTLAAVMAATTKKRNVTLHDLLGPFGLDARGRVVDASPEAKARRDRFLRHAD